MFNPSDVYVTGGSNDLLVCWTDKVTKYDASSFYNWEQDNLPLHDLDERTHLLWEKLGHPTSALTGMSFIVSADATDSCSPLYFTTLSACINALPEVINYPILIEVASFGNLGGLNLSNKAFGPNGALEIINRNSAFAFPRSLDTTRSHHSVLEYDSDFTDYSLASAITLDTTAASPIVNNFPVPNVATDHVISKMYTRKDDGSEISLASGTANLRHQDPRFTHPYIFAKRVDDQVNNRLSVGLSSTADPWDTAATSYSGTTKFIFNPYDKTNNDDVYDVSTLNYLTDTEVAWGDGSEATNQPKYGAMSFSYFNNLEYIKVNECNGPVYIRNFNVDGQHNVDRGIEITNSKVNLERCSVSRCNKAGLYAGNSEVNILRGIVAYRNYEVINSARTGVPFADKRLSYKTQDSYGAGVYAHNSTINFKSTYDRDIEKSLESSALSIYAAGLAIYGIPGILPGSSIPLPSQEALTCFSRNDIGIHAVNSVITGGRTELNGLAVGDSWHDAMQVFCELNTEAGIKLENSLLDYSGRLLIDGNYYGVDSCNSKLKVDTLNTRYNQSTGLRLKDSHLTYNKDLYAGAHLSKSKSVGPETFREGQLGFIQNGAGLEANNSTVKPLFTSSTQDLYQTIYVSGLFGNPDEGYGAITPSIFANNNSDLDLIHTHINYDHLPLNSLDDGIKGLFAKAEGESTITFRGSVNYATVFQGPENREDQLYTAGVCADKNSNIKIQGPTASYQVGVNFLIENNSNLIMSPHQNDNGRYLVSAFNLSDNGNHTMVELHSTRACLVANKNSNVYMHDLGDKTSNWARGTIGGALLAGQDYTGDALHTSAGYVQFYPNAVIDPNGAGWETVSPGTTYKFNTETNIPSKKYQYLFDTTGEFSSVTTGGMCVRAIEDSLVHVNNVHFPTGWSNCSSVVYDYQGDAPLPGPACSRLFIWNIADNSLLKAFNVSVSGLYPADSGYFGPSGVWGNTVSGAPSGTPDTSSLSILDYYGRNTISVFGQSSAKNFGPFRLYFSVDPAANYLVASGTNDLDGMARQLFSQGYSFSGNLSAVTGVDVDGSGYTSLLRNYNEVAIVSGFYYPSAMMYSPFTIKAVLDESAANSFANAKHNSVGKSGLAKVVHVVQTNTDQIGGDSNRSYDYGGGLGSINNFDLYKDN